MRFDLHTHSTVSDGAFPPSEVVRRAAEAGLDGIALTDHDSTAGLAPALAEGERLGVRVLAGCEVSAEERGVSVHILAYFMDPDHPRFAEEMRWIRDDRVVRAEKMVEKLQDLGVPITMEQVRRLAKGESIARPHVAAAMVESGVIRRTVEAFTADWILEGGRAYVGKKTHPPEGTVDLIREAGGAAVIAHPIWVERDLGGVEAMIERLAERGMAGIEVDHPDQRPEERRWFAKVAERLGLIATASSDYHGNEHGGVIGSNVSGPEIVEALRARAADRGA